MILISNLKLWLLGNNKYYCYYSSWLLTPAEQLCLATGLILSVGPVLNAVDV